MLKPEPIVLFAVHPEGCACGRPNCRSPVSRVEPKRSLSRRFRDAAAPGDWAALAIGAQLGIAFFALLDIFKNWDVIAPFLAALW